jgi:TetR/AcrR family transcriptional regulator, regulator of cefoperazone and chloramphenicol sensitivity
MDFPDDTQRRLLESAGQVFAEKGFKAATVREICQLAGANIAAINYYFRDKERLYSATLNYAFECKSDLMAMPAWPEGTSGEQKLRAFIHTVLTHMLEEQARPWQMQLLIRELSNPSPAGKDLVQNFIRPIYEFLWGLLREVLPAEVPEDKLHLTAISIIGQCLYMRISRKVIPLVVGEEEFRSYTADRLADHIADFSLAALEGQGAGSRG